MEPSKVGNDLLDLVEREEEMMKRGVLYSNLIGVRKRIITLFLQLIRSPDHNPEILRYEKVNSCNRVMCKHVTTAYFPATTRSGSSHSKDCFRT